MNSINRENPFENLKVRSLFVWFLVSVPIGVLVAVLIDILIDFDKNPAVQFVVFGVWLYGLIFIWALWKFNRLGIGFRSFVGNLPKDYQWSQTVCVVVSILLFSLGSFWIIYYPLSFISPAFVRSVLSKPSLAVLGTSRPIFHNILILLIGVIIAPVIEEILFRGILLHRWSIKWDNQRAMLVSSLVFAIPHMDSFFGNFVFGVVMGMLYIKTRTLIVPIISHMLNNAAAFGLGIFNVFFMSAKTVDVLDEFRSYVWFGVLCTVLSVPWTVYFIRKNWAVTNDELPHIEARRTSSEMGTLVVKAPER